MTVLYSFILTTLKKFLCVQRGFSYSKNLVKNSDFTTFLPKFIKLLYSRNLKRTYLKHKNIKKLYRLVEDVYNSSVVAEVFCENFPEIAEIGNSTPLMHLIHQKIDKAYAMLINTKPKIV